MSQSINWGLVEWANTYELELTGFKAKSQGKDLGCFDIETLQVTVHLSDQEFSRVEEAINLLHDPIKKSGFSSSQISRAESIFLKYFQVHSHEYFHLYQTIFLPVVSRLRVARYNKLKHEAGLLFHCFEQEKTFKLSRLNELTDVLKPDFDLQLNENFIDSYNDALETFKFYEEKWGLELHGLSCYHIFEGMAHIASLQLSDDPVVDLNNLGGDEYWKAFNFFQSNLSNPENRHIRFRYLIFLYICFFSCQVVDHPDDNCSEPIPLQTFIYLCGLSDFFFDSMEKFKAVYKKATVGSLFEVDRWEISDYLDEANSETISSVFALMETVEIMAKKAVAFRPDREFTSETYTKLVESTHAYNLKCDDFLLGRLLIFPVCFSGIYAWSCEAMDDLKEKDGFTLRQEAQFYQFVKNIRNLFKDRRRKSIPLHCCATHGDVDDERQFLNCPYDDSQANKIYLMAKRKAYSVFELF